MIHLERILTKTLKNTIYLTMTCALTIKIKCTLNAHVEFHVELCVLHCPSFGASEARHDKAPPSSYLEHLVVCPVRSPFRVGNVDDPLQVFAKLHCQEPKGFVIAGQKKKWERTRQERE